MAILTVEEFKLAFDAERVKELASDFSEFQGRPEYNEVIVESVIAQAEGYIKAALSKQYSTTELEADKSIERITADIAMYYLEFRRNQFTPSVESAFERAVRFVKKLEDGSFKLEAVAQLLPKGETSQPTEALELGDGFFKFTDDESDLLT